MPESGVTFTDWQGSNRRGLVVDDDFSWSDTSNSRRRATASGSSRSAVSGTIVIERDDWTASEDRQLSARTSDESAYEPDHEARDEPSFDLVPVDRYDYPEVIADDGYAALADRSDVYAQGAPQIDPVSGRRTVVITGRGAERYPAPRRRRDSEAAFYQRASFKPDSVAMWAVLLGIALLLGSIAH